MLFTAKVKSAGRVSSIIAVSFISLLYFTPRSAVAKDRIEDLQNQISAQQQILDSLLDSACPERYVMQGIDAGGNILCTYPKQDKLFVFVSSESYTGNLGGVAGADAYCQALADASTLPAGVYKAWISGSTAESSPSQRFTGTPHNLPYYLPDGLTRVADDWGRMVSGELLHAINMDEGAINVVGLAWTATAFDGTPWFTRDTCGGWWNEEVNVDGVVGDTSAMGTNWTFAGWPLCNLEQRLYCIEQLIQ